MRSILCRPLLKAHRRLLPSSSTGVTPHPRQTFRISSLLSVGRTTLQCYVGLRSMECALKYSIQNTVFVLWLIQSINGKLDPVQIRALHSLNYMMCSKLISYNITRCARINRSQKSSSDIKVAWYAILITANKINIK